MPWFRIVAARLRLAAAAGMLALLSACLGGGGGPADWAAVPPDDAPGAAAQPRLVVLGRAGEIASMGLAAPWPVLARAHLQLPIRSLRCRAGLCAVAHPAPGSAISLVDAATLALLQRVALPSGSDPRDVVFTGDHTLVVSLGARAYLLELDTVTGAQRRIPLDTLADADGQPEPDMLAACGRQVYVQLRRLDGATGQRGTLPPLIAVVDTWDGDHLQALPLALTPALDMQVDCAARTLLVTEPQPIIEGHGKVELVDLRAGTVRDVLGPEEFANGGMLRITPTLYWLNQHTDFGPGPSSHLTLVGGAGGDVYNVFATEPVDNLAWDPAGGRLYYPNPCATLPGACDAGVHVFDALTGVSAGPSIDPGFPPVELAVSR